MMTKTQLREWNTELEKIAGHLTSSERRGMAKKLAYWVHRLLETAEQEEDEEPFNFARN
jgi:hypothetical protein